LATNSTPLAEELCSQQCTCLHALGKTPFPLWTYAVFGAAAYFLTASESQLRRNHDELGRRLYIFSDAGRLDGRSGDHHPA
jgi:hypothetical protein